MTEIHSPNGGLKVGADLTGNADFFTIYTVIEHDAGDFGGVNGGARNALRLSEIIQLFANMNYVDVKSAVVDLSDAAVRAVYGLGTNFNQAATTVYTIKFLVEQSGFVVPATLAATLNGVVVPFSTVGVPHAGGPVTLTAYNTVDAADTNLVILMFADL